jgi:hypothetical protein
MNQFSHRMSEGTLPYLGKIFIFDEKCAGVWVIYISVHVRTDVSDVGSEPQRLQYSTRPELWSGRGRTGKLFPFFTIYLE